MDYAGLLGKFKTSRPLNTEEVRHRMAQGQRQPVEPHYQLSVIKLNSTYLEVVDKWYGEKGLLTAAALIAMAILCGGFSLMGAMLMGDAMLEPSGPDSRMFLFNGIAMIGVSIAVGWAISFALRKESFAYTHYPIRFNRRTGMVHVFRTNGTVLSVPWAKLYFTLAPVDHLHKYWNILGHVLENDQATVKETFALSVSEMGTPEGLTIMRSHWEFVRRYMEEGPASVVGQVQFCLPLSDRRETFQFGMHRLLANNSGATLYSPVTAFSMAVDFLLTPFRYFAMRTSRIPQWPAEIDIACAIDDNDPYAIAGARNGDRVASYPRAAEQAGVRFNEPRVKPVPAADKPVRRQETSRKKSKADME